MEKWADVKDYEGLYQVSNLGRLRSVERFDKLGRLLRSKLKRFSQRYDGYVQISLGLSSSTQKQMYLHQIVAKAFILNPNGKRFVNHKDGNKQNNSVENLEWVTYQENMDHAVRIGLQNTKGENNKQHKIKEAQVIKIREMYNDDNRTSLSEIGRKFNLTRNHIFDIVKRRTWTHI